MYIKSMCINLIKHNVHVSMLSDQCKPNKQRKANKKSELKILPKILNDMYLRVKPLIRLFYIGFNVCKSILLNLF